VALLPLHADNAAQNAATLRRMTSSNSSGNAAPPFCPEIGQISIF
jgi:hypothetical protein